MKLTRRDAVAALSAAGAVVGGAVALDSVAEGGLSPEELADGASGGIGDSRETTIDDDALDTLTRVAEVLYPSRVENVAEFVETYANGRLVASADRRAQLLDVLGELDDVARDWEDAPFHRLDRETRDELLRSLAVDTADPVPDGSLTERLRYYVVNDLLYAFYASPTGSELAGTPNPIGYPGGYRTALSPDNRRADPSETGDPTENTGQTETSDPTEDESAGFGGQNSE